jgi:hypothetical protein
MITTPFFDGHCQLWVISGVETRHSDVRVALNGFALWNVILLMFMIVEYGYPIGQFFVLKSSVPVYQYYSRAVREK